MDFNRMMTYVAALECLDRARHRVCQALPPRSRVLSTQKTGAAENVPIICVHLLAVVIRGVICGIFPKTLLPTGIALPAEFWNKAGYCLIFGLLASGGSGFWNSALDTLRNVKTKMGS